MSTTGNILEGREEAPATPKEGKRISCDFCKCSLSPSGDVLKMSDHAKGLRDSNDTIEKLQAQLKAAVEENKALKDELGKANSHTPEVPANGSTEVPTRSSLGKPWRKS